MKYRPEVVTSESGRERKRGRRGRKRDVRSNFFLLLPAPGPPCRDRPPNTKKVVSLVEWGRPAKCRIVEGREEEASFCCSCKFISIWNIFSNVIIRVILRLLSLSLYSITHNLLHLLLYLRSRVQPPPLSVRSYVMSIS